MKLNKAIADTTPELSMEEFLQMENDFLRDEIEIAALEHDLELCQTVLKCIEEEGTVSKSVEIMFGETFTNMANAKDELSSHIESISNELLDKRTETRKTIAVFDQMDKMIGFISRLTMDDLRYLKFPLPQDVFSKFIRLFNFLVKVKRLGEKVDFRQSITSEKGIDDAIAHLKSMWNNTDDSVLSQRFRDEAGDIQFKDATELMKWIKRIKSKIDEFKEGFKFALKHSARLRSQDRELKAEIKKHTDLSDEKIKRYEAEIIRLVRIGMRLMLDFGRKLMVEIDKAKKPHMYKEFDDK